MHMSPPKRYCHMTGPGTLFYCDGPLIKYLLHMVTAQGTWCPFNAASGITLSGTASGTPSDMEYASNPVFLVHCRESCTGTLSSWECTLCHWPIPSTCAFALEYFSHGMGAKQSWQNSSHGSCQLMPACFSSTLVYFKS